MDEEVAGHVGLVAGLDLGCGADNNGGARGRHYEGPVGDAVKQGDFDGRPFEQGGARLYVGGRVSAPGVRLQEEGFAMGP